MKRVGAGADVSTSSGFTLIEVIVALTILGFIILMVSGTFRLGLSRLGKGGLDQGGLSEDSDDLPIGIPADKVCRSL